MGRWQGFVAVHPAALMEKNGRNGSALKADDGTPEAGLLRVFYHLKIICVLPFETC